ncbi:hypothetical protein [Geoglobus ahangari]|nr:hypothetical protein [Geoglobus ahangari]
MEERKKGFFHGRKVHKFHAKWKNSAFFTVLCDFWRGDPMDKPVKISVHVNEDEWLAFKNYVLSKYGCLWKYLGEELSKAIKLYLSQVADAHTRK